MKKSLILILSLMFIFSVGILFTGCEEAAPETYIGYSQADGYGYVEAEVTIVNGAIEEVELTEFNEQGVAKGEDYPWDEFHEAMEVLPDRFVEADEYDVEGITEATNTVEKAQEAVKMTLEKDEGIEEFTGTYMGVSSFEDPEEDSWGVAIVTVEDGNITAVELDEVSDGEFKGEDYPLDEFHEAKDVLPERFVEANSSEVDAYTGATGSSDDWMEAVADALDKAGL